MSRSVRASWVWAASYYLGAVLVLLFLVMPVNAEVRAFLMLRAWMLYRCTALDVAGGGGWAFKKKARERWLADEADTLARDIAALGVPGGGTGHPLADSRIREWWPRALTPP